MKYSQKSEKKATDVSSIKSHFGGSVSLTYEDIVKILVKFRYMNDRLLETDFKAWFRELSDSSGKIKTDDP